MSTASDAVRAGVFPAWVVVEPPNESNSSAVDPFPNFSGGFVIPEDGRDGLYDRDEEYGWDCDLGAMGEGEVWDLLTEGDEDE